MFNIEFFRSIGLSLKNLHKAHKLRFSAKSGISNNVCYKYVLFSSSGKHTYFIWYDTAPYNDVCAAYYRDENYKFGRKRVAYTVSIEDIGNISKYVEFCVYYRDHNGRNHREDGPAVEWEDGTKEWYKNGKLHREDGPTVEYADGGKEWHKKGKLHREDGPAIERVDGTKEWYKNGMAKHYQELLYTLTRIGAPNSI